MQSEKATQCLRVPGDDAGASSRSWVGFQDSLGLQHSDGLPDRTAAHAQFPGQIAFRGQLRPYLVLPVEQRRLNVIQRYPMRLAVVSLQHGVIVSPEWRSSRTTGLIEAPGALVIHSFCYDQAVSVRERRWESGTDAQR